MEYAIRVVDYKKSFDPEKEYFLAGDIGGTNSNFALVDMNAPTPTLLISLHAMSQSITDYADLVSFLCQKIKKDYGVTITHGCFGVAGIISHDRCFVRPTHIDVPIDCLAIKQKAHLDELLLINDFVAVAMGYDCIDPSDIVCINSGKDLEHTNKAFLGAGTGLGKSALIWNDHLKHYVPMASEGGHADFPAQDPYEYALVEYNKQILKKTCDFKVAAHPEGLSDSESVSKGLYEWACPVSWEHILSGTGISTIYQFLGEHKKFPETVISREIEHTRFKPDKISAYAQKDERCRETFLLYTKFYARCAKDFALDTLSRSGMYIAGGIAAHNVQLFKSSLFMEHFIRCGQHQEMLKQVPVYVITDYNVSLYGAAQYMKLFQQDIL